MTLAPTAGEGAEAVPWQLELPPELRAEIRALHALAPPRNLAILGFFLLWAAGCVASLAGPWPLVPLAGIVVSGVALHALATFMHEGSHGNLFRRRALDRWVGLLCSLPTGLGPTAYRVAHLEHHRHVRTPLDPEDFLNLTGRRWVHVVAFWGWAAVGAVSYVLLVPAVGWSRGRGRDRVRIVVEYALMLSCYGAAFAIAGALGETRALLLSWIYPCIVVLLITNVRGWAEHALTPARDAWTKTRTVRSNRLVSVLLGGTNFHLEHHLFPGVPWYRLGRLHALLAEQRRQRHAPVYRSYGSFLLDAARSGVHGLARGTE